eukprot:TRINITY_DN3480_c0_g1_i1.p1 TRINITY_DN3480_c0_g1~~TRINITY_DN3480_c0_g1_i1.p1  ORF type:complete len:229 (+),score=23.77 TRINITY_DN3480_c0_g1_i1:43-687(+)
MKQLKTEEKVDLKSLRYLNEDSIQEDLLCPICRLPFNEPVEHPIIGKGGCSQVYCQDCVRNLNSCPHCQNPVSSWNILRKTPAIQRFLFNPLDELRVYCPTCDCSVARGQLLDHMNICLKPCSRGCGVEITPNKEKEHESICTNMIIPCRALNVMCPWQGPRKNSIEHEEKCPYVQLQPLLKSLMDENKQLRLEIAEKGNCPTGFFTYSRSRNS